MTHLEPTQDDLVPEANVSGDLLIPGSDNAQDDIRVEALEEVLSPGFERANVSPLGTGEGLLRYFPLLRELTRLGEVEFVTRMGIIGEMASADRTRWSLDDLHNHFLWLTKTERERAFRGLRRSGWLDYGTNGYTLSQGGEAVYAMMSALLGTSSADGDIALGVIEVEMAGRFGADRTVSLRHLRHNLRKVISEAEEAVTSFSEVKILEARERMDRNLAWSMRAREILDELDIGDFPDYKTAQAIGRSLSELHQWHGTLQRALNDIAHQRIHLGESGLSFTDITHFLMKCDVDEIAEFGERFVSQSIRPNFAIVDNVLCLAEDYLYFNERPIDEEHLGWREGSAQDAEVAEVEAERFAALARFAGDLTALKESGEAQTLAEFVPTPTWMESAYRMSLLTLVENDVPVSAGLDTAMAVLMDQMRECPLKMEAQNGGLRIDGEGVSEISVGTLTVVPVDKSVEEES